MRNKPVATRYQRAPKFKNEAFNRVIKEVKANMKRVLPTGWKYEAAEISFVDLVSILMKIDEEEVCTNSSTSKVIGTK